MTKGLFCHAPKLRPERASTGYYGNQHGPSGLPNNVLIVWLSMASPASDVRRFGRYEVLDEVGRGTMGVVYLARDPAIHRIVAIKSVSLAGQPPEAQSEYRERFMREAEAAGRLSHAGIVTVFDVGEEPETHTPYIVMEYIKGKSLEHAGKLTSRVAAGLVRELAEALDYAHRQGVVHRDLKPSNILLTEDGHAKIADFGVAKLNLSELTVNGQILGTPAFMSPEQLKGDPVDGRSDLFSLGVILYTLLTGHRPFQGNSVVTVSFKVVHHEPVPVEVLNLNLPPGLNDIVCRAMAKDPAQRYQRGAEMAGALKNILDEPELWNGNKEPGSNPPGLFEIADRVYANATQKREATGARMVAELQHISKRLVTSRGWRTLGLLSCIGAIAAIGIWQNLRQPLEAAPVSPSAPTADQPVRANAVPAPRAVTPPGTSRSASGSHSVPLRISANTKLRDATLTLWVDEQRALNKKLDAPSKKKFGLFGHAGADQSENVYIAPGQHHLRVNVQSASESYDESLSVRGSFPEGSERVLLVTFSNDNEMKVRLK
jgi:serine/threonine protein kinase